MEWTQTFEHHCIWTTYTSMQAQDEHEVDAFHLAMNSMHPKIKFAIEKPIESNNGLSLALLGFKVTIQIKMTQSSISIRNQRENQPLYAIN